jgi:hypothetical protein
MEGFLAVFIVWMCISFVAGFWLGMDYLLGADLWELFWLPNKLSAELCEEYSINKAGQCIIDIWFNIIMLPSMILASAIIGLLYIITVPIMFFAWVFRKR